MPHILYDGFVDDEFSGVPPVIVVVDLGHLEFLRKKIPLVHALRKADEDLAGVSFWDFPRSGTNSISTIQIMSSSKISMVP